jgi:RNA polymerase sigma-70 factor (ECF subfamily)
MSNPAETSESHLEVADSADRVQNLVRRAKDGDEAAFDDLVREFQRPVFNLAYRMLNNYEEANDAAQDVFIKVHRSLASFRGDSKFSTWLFTVAANMCRSRIRKIVRLNKHEAGSLDETYDDDTSPKQVAVDPAAGADTLLENQEVKQIVEACINELDDDFKLVMIMKDLQHMQYEEIAEALDCNLGTIKSRLFRARAQVRDKLKERLTGYFD